MRAIGEAPVTRREGALAVRIALLALHFAEYASLLARGLAREHDVLLVLGEENYLGEVGDPSHVSNIANLRVEYVAHTRNPLHVPQRAWTIAAAIRAFRPDIIHCQETTRDYLALALPFLPRVPFVLTVHDPQPHSGWDAARRNRSRHGWYVGQLRRRANWAIVHGASLVASAESCLPHLKGRVSVVPHGPLGGFMEPIGGDWEPGLCLFFGRIEEYKGLPLFIDAIRTLRKRGVKARGLIAGRGSELDRYRAELTGDEAFELLEKYLSPPEVREVFRRAQAVVMPYREATQSGVAAYALGLGRPVVASRVGAIGEMLEGHPLAVLVPPQDRDSLCSAVERVLGAELSPSVRDASNDDVRNAWANIASATCNAAYRPLLGNVS